MLGAKIKFDEDRPGRPAVELECFLDCSSKEFAEIAALKSLRRVILSGGVCDDHLVPLTELKALEAVKLSSLADFSPVGIERLAQLTQLRELYLFSLDHVAGDRTNSGLRPLGKLKNLERLTINDVSIYWDGSWLAELSGLTHLRFLDLGRMNITDEGVKHLAKLPALEHLNLNRSQITNHAMEWLKEMPKLTYLSIDDTDVTRRAYKAFLKARPDVKVNWSKRDLRFLSPG